MIYNTPVYFQNRTQGAYNAQTGDYAADVVTETKVYADVTDAGISFIKLVYGQLKQGVKVVRIQGKYTNEFSTIRIGDKVYRPDLLRRLSRSDVYTVSEVQNGRV